MRTWQYDEYSTTINSQLMCSVSEESRSLRTLIIATLCENHWLSLRCVLLPIMKHYRNPHFFLSILSFLLLCFSLIFLSLVFHVFAPLQPPLLQFGRLPYAALQLPFVISFAPSTSLSHAIRPSSYSFALGCRWSLDRHSATRPTPRHWIWMRCYP